MIRFILSTLFLLSSLLPTPVFAAGDPPAVPPLNGQWRGPLKMLGGEITVAITIVPLTNGAYYAALDAPQQRISRMPVEVELKGDNLTLRIEQAGSSFVGKVLDGGATFQGTWKQPGVTAPMTLKRAAASAVAATKFKATPPYRVSDVTFTPRYSTDLSNWQNSAFIYVGSVNNGDGAETVKGDAGKPDLLDGYADAVDGGGVFHDSADE